MFDWDSSAIVTHFLLGAFILETLLCHFGITTPLQYYHSLPLIIRKGEVWRLWTNLFYLGNNLDLDFLFHIMFFINYSTQLESSQFRNKKIDFIFMLAFIITMLNILAPLTSSLLMSSSFIYTICFIWSRHNPHITMALFGIITFRAPFLPLFLSAFTWLFGGNIDNDLCGLFVGHLYFFFKFLAPQFHPTIDILATPKWFIFIANVIYSFVSRFFNVVMWILGQQNGNNNNNINNNDNNLIHNDINHNQFNNNDINTHNNTESIGENTELTPIQIAVQKRQQHNEEQRRLKLQLEQQHKNQIQQEEDDIVDESDKDSKLNELSQFDMVMQDDTNNYTHETNNSKHVTTSTLSLDVGDNNNSANNDSDKDTYDDLNHHNFNQEDEETLFLRRLASPTDNLYR